jgi:hypothetical protein
MLFRPGRVVGAPSLVAASRRQPTPPPLILHPVAISVEEVGDREIRGDVPTIDVVTGEPPLGVAAVRTGTEHSATEYEPVARKRRR